MSAMSFARQAFSREKPHSSITDWVDILTGVNIQDEAYDGIPELVDSINLQAAGPTEASRAIRKKLKHGNSHQQYRALVILKALVENCGHKFQTSFADGQLTDALKNMALDLGIDQKVKNKLTTVLASWHHQFKSDPSMALVAGLYKQCRLDARHQSQYRNELANLRLPNDDYEKKKLEREEAKKKAKREREEAKEKERRRKEEEERRRGNNKNRRGRFDFEKEKPNVLTSIVDASQASSNLVNAITLANPAAGSLQSNERVQECLTKAKQSRKIVVRYIQLVENEEIIGTLIEANERVIAAMEMYDTLSSQSDPSTTITAGLAATSIGTSESELNKLQEKQRAAVERAKQHGSIRGRGVEGHTEEQLHPDLQDISFGPIGSSSNNLPPPLQPSTLSDDGDNRNEYVSYDARGSLSDFSDHESSDEAIYDAAGTPSFKRRKAGRNYVDVSDDPDDEDEVDESGTSARDQAGQTTLVDVNDPFADPFADEVAVTESSKQR